MTKYLYAGNSLIPLMYGDLDVRNGLWIFVGKPVETGRLGNCPHCGARDYLTTMGTHEGLTVLRHTCSPEPVALWVPPDRLQIVDELPPPRGAMH